MLCTQRIQANLNGHETGANFVGIIFHVIEYFDSMPNSLNFSVDYKLNQISNKMSLISILNDYNVVINNSEALCIIYWMYIGRIRNSNQLGILCVLQVNEIHLKSYSKRKRTKYYRIYMRGEFCITATTVYCSHLMFIYKTQNITFFFFFVLFNFGALFIQSVFSSLSPCISTVEPHRTYTDLRNQKRKFMSYALSPTITK